MLRELIGTKFVSLSVIIQGENTTKFKQSRSPPFVVYCCIIIILFIILTNTPIFSHISDHAVFRVATIKTSCEE